MQRIRIRDKDKMEQKYARISRNAKRHLQLDLQYIKKSPPFGFDHDKGLQLIITDRDAAQKIEKHPDAIQKLVWRALYYKREIEARNSIALGVQNGEYEKLTKFIESYRHAQQLIIKLCKKHGLRPIIIDGGS